MHAFLAGALVSEPDFSDRPTQSCISDTLAIVSTWNDRVSEATAEDLEH